MRRRHPFQGRKEKTCRSSSRNEASVHKRLIFTRREELQGGMYQKGCARKEEGKECRIQKKESVLSLGTRK